MPVDSEWERKVTTPYDTSSLKMSCLQGHLSVSLNLLSTYSDSGRISVGYRLGGGEREDTRAMHNKNVFEKKFVPRSTVKHSVGWDVRLIAK